MWTEGISNAQAHFATKAQAMWTSAQVGITGNR